MDEKLKSNLEQLEQLFQYTCQVCDPLDYAVRQRNLVYTLTNYLLLPLTEYRQELAKKEAEEKTKQETLEVSSTLSETPEQIQ